MENKYSTLYTIYELVKNESDPTAVILHTAEIIIRQHLPWNEIGQHLNELREEGLIEIRQLNTAVIYITTKGLRFCTSQPVEQAA
jgi:predicted transcriptional regulator